MKIWLIGTTRVVVPENEFEAATSQVGYYLDMSLPDHSYIYGDFTICPLEHEVPGQLQRVCAVGAEKLVIQRADGLSAPFRMASTWPRSVALQATAMSSKLDAKIPAPDRAQYLQIRDAKDWLNPEVTVRAYGVEITSAAFSIGYPGIPLEELPAALAGLPASAWPYGRVVIGSEPGLRNSGDTPLIRTNRAEVARILKALNVEVTWFPPA